MLRGATVLWVLAVASLAAVDQPVPAAQLCLSPEAFMTKIM
jgi:hypothetical protein